MKKLYILLSVAAAALAAVCVAALLVYNGVVLLNDPPLEDYPVRGVDVSHYQGDIDWETLASQGNISFAFIKATEGSSYVDDYFAFNWEQSQKTALRVGAYHFFSFDSAGKTQAENFINTVEAFDGMLPPVIDLEFYDSHASFHPEADAVRAELDDLIAALEEHYGVNPVIYTSEDCYKLYLAGGYGDCDIWIRNVITRPKLSDGREWTFWQYTNRMKLDGYSGEERFIDMNVFRGSREEFESYGK